MLADAVDYLVRTDDEEDDLRSPIGFEDDAEVVEAALEQDQAVRAGMNGLGLPAHVTTSSSRARLHAT